MKKRLSVLFAVVVALTVLMLFSATAAADTQVYGVEQTWTQSWPATQESATFQVKVEQSGFYDWHITDNNRTGSLELYISDTESEDGYWFTYDLKDAKEATTVEKNVPLIANHTYDVTLYYTTEIDDEGDFDFLTADMSIVIKNGASEIQELSGSNKEVALEDYTTTVFSFTTEEAGDYEVLSGLTFGYESHLLALDPETFEVVSYGYIAKGSGTGALRSLEANRTYYLLMEMEGANTAKRTMRIRKTTKDIARISQVYPKGDPFLADMEFTYNLKYTDGSSVVMLSADQIAKYGYYPPTTVYSGEGFYNAAGEYIMVAGKQPFTVYFYDQEETFYITVSKIVDVYADFPALKPGDSAVLSNSGSVNVIGGRLTPSKTAAYDFYVYGNYADDFWDTAFLEIYDETNRLVEAGKNGYPLVAGRTYFMIIQYEGWNSALGDCVLYYQEEGAINPPLNTGWKQEGGYWCYYDDLGYKVKRQWVEDSKGWCYLDEEGHMATSQWIPYGDTEIYVDATGHRVSSQWIKDSIGWRYVGPGGGSMRNYWKEDAEGWCYLGPDGYMVTNRWLEDTKGLVYMGADGHMVSNQWATYKGVLYYMGSDGYIAKNCWAKRDGKWSYLDANGYIATGCWKKDSKGWCYLDEEGYMVTNNWVPDSKDLVYVGADGYMVVNKWIEDDHGWRYVGSDGYPTRKTWKKDSKGWCYLGADGYMVTDNWVPDSKGYVFVGSNGYMVTNSWVADVEGLRYVGADGYITRNKWAKLQGKWCYLDADGYMATDCWKKDSKGWCYLDGEGFMVTNQWVPDSVGIVYVGSDGYMVVNKWIEDETGWRYAGPQGYYLKNCWQKDSKGWCYLQDNGYMVTEGWVKDSVGWCYLDASGYWDGKYAETPPVEVA